MAAANAAYTSRIGHWTQSRISLCNPKCKRNRLSYSSWLFIAVACVCVVLTEVQATELAFGRDYEFKSQTNLYELFVNSGSSNFGQATDYAVYVTTLNPEDASGCPRETSSSNFQLVSFKDATGSDLTNFELVYVGRSKANMHSVYPEEIPRSAGFISWLYVCDDNGNTVTMRLEFPGAQPSIPGGIAPAPTRSPVVPTFEPTDSPSVKVSMGSPTISPTVNETRTSEEPEQENTLYFAIGGGVAGGLLLGLAFWCWAFRDYDKARSRSHAKSSHQNSMLNSNSITLLGKTSFNVNTSSSAPQRSPTYYSENEEQNGNKEFEWGDDRVSKNATEIQHGLSEVHREFDDTQQEDASTRGYSLGHGFPMSGEVTYTAASTVSSRVRDENEAYLWDKDIEEDELDV